MFEGHPYESPPLAAAFLIEFDNRAGYTIKWERSIPDVQLEGVVEYKSLPSGLHNIKEDLVYFVHDDYAGLSAFHNESASESERGAHMLAVGVLVPLRYGRLGKSWRHAQRLKDLARQIAGDMNHTELLEDYWEKHRIHDDDSGVADSPFASPSTLKFNNVEKEHANGGPPRNRGISDATPILSSPQTLSPYHPALSLPEFIATFGPLVFPLYRAALLRKRILIIGEAPVQITNNFVYDLSILSNVPSAVQSILSSDLPPPRVRPLFNVGIHDIPFLESLSETGAPPKSSSDDFDPSWVACTTDHVLATKTNLYDVLVTLPPPYSKSAASKVYPQISTPHHRTSKIKPAKKPSHSPYADQYPIKATQRDARRYATLQRGLRRLPRSDPLAPAFPKLIIPNSAFKPKSNGNPSAEDVSDNISTTSSTSPNILEPLAWPLFAYNSFIWWASAGESARTELEEESTHDSDLLFSEVDHLATSQPSAVSIDVPGLNSTSDQEVNHPPGRRPRGKSISKVGFGEGMPVREMALVAYFHRLTTLMFSTLAGAIAREDGDDGEDDEEEDAVADDDAEYEERISSADHNSSSTNKASNRQNQKKWKHRAENGHDESAPLIDRDEGGAEEVLVTPEDVSSMGLDVWSEADRYFIQEVAGLWFGRRVKVTGGSLECCGVKVY